MTVTVHGDASGVTQDVIFGRHGSTADESEAQREADTGPSPYDYLLLALGA